MWRGCAAASASQKVGKVLVLIFRRVQVRVDELNGVGAAEDQIEVLPVRL